MAAAARGRLYVTVVRENWRALVYVPSSVSFVFVGGVVKPFYLSRPSPKNLFLFAQKLT